MVAGHVGVVEGCFLDPPSPVEVSLGIDPVLHAGCECERGCEEDAKRCRQVFHSSHGLGLFEGCSINYGIRNVQKKVLTVVVAIK